MPPCNKKKEDNYKVMVVVIIYFNMGDSKLEFSFANMVALL